MPKTLADVHAELTAAGQMFEIETVDVRGVQTKVFKNAPATLRDVVALSALHGDKDYLVFEDERITFAQHHAMATTFANRLADEYGVRKGDRVAIAMRNFPEWVIAFFAITSAGGIAVPLNAWWKTDELVYGLADSGSVVMIADEDRAEALHGKLDDTPVRQVIVARPERDLRSGEVDFSTALGELIDGAEPPTVDIDTDDDATIFYTSGTTGNPKGALGTHRNICTAIMSSAFGAVAGAQRKAEAGEGGGIDLGDLASGAAAQASLVSVPFFHVTGCHGFLLTSTAFGIKLVLMYKWDPGRALELIERERISTIGGVPSMVLQLLDHPDFDSADTSTVQTISYGGAPAPPELVKRVRTLLPGRTPTNGWGMTETSAAFAMNGGPDYVVKPDAVGPAFPTGEAKVVDDEGSEVPLGERGELWVKGPNVIKGYWNKPDANAETFVDGWLRTGDIARLDDEGFIYIVDRAKDMIIRGGENVYCAEVEAAIFEIDGVGDCAVIGVPHDILGEEVGAVIIPKRGATIDPAAVTAHVKNTLAGFKAPTHVWLRDSDFPRNAAGKILKRDLRNEVVSP